jgi:hypothetical protein
MRDIILSFLNTLDFEMEDEDVEHFIQYVNYKILNIEYEFDERPPKYFRTLLFLFNKEKI